MRRLGETFASALAIIEADIFTRIHDHKINRIDAPLSWNWEPVESQAEVA